MPIVLELLVTEERIYEMLAILNLAIIHSFIHQWLISIRELLMLVERLKEHQGIIV